MKYDDDTCYQALLSRDSRFDGVFYTGVTSTGIYCRPICPARTPMRRHCTFHPSAAAAELAGFRPCLRCRPETGPGSPAWRGTDTTVERALRLIDEGALDDASAPDLAARLGVGDRHLRRLFMTHVGAAPRDVARTRRLHLARRLLLETDLNISQVALTAGFGTVRRFHAAASKVWGRTPTQIRAARRRKVFPGSGITLRQTARQPFDWNGVLDYIRPRLMSEVETMTDSEYLRCVCIGDDVGIIRVRQASDGIDLTVPDSLTTHLRLITTRVRLMFDLETDPLAIAEHLGADPDLKPLVAKHHGIRLPRAWDPFELTVRAVLGQQISVAAASTLAARVVASWGVPIEHPEGDVTRLFPTPNALAHADLTTVGVTRARAETIKRIAWAIVDGSLDLDDPTTAPDVLLALRGVGPWTVSYVQLRAWGYPDAFPAGDLGLRKAMSKTGEPWTEARLRKHAEVWRPWRGYAARLLWASLSEKSEA